jgi:hypothetical protein
LNVALFVSVTVITLFVRLTDLMLLEFIVLRSMTPVPAFIFAIVPPNPPTSPPEILLLVSFSVLLLASNVTSSVLATLPVISSVAPLSIWRLLTPLPMLALRSSVSPEIEATMLPEPEIALVPVETVPAPVRVAPIPMVRPELSVSVAPVPARLIVPLVMLSAPFSVRLPVLAISSVWLLLFIATLVADAVFEISRTEAEPLLMFRATLATVPARLSVPPLAVAVPVPSPVILALTVPAPLRFAPLLSVRPEESLNMAPPPRSVILPLVMFSAPVSVRLPVLAISSVWLLLLIATLVAVAVPEISRTDWLALLIPRVTPVTVPTRLRAWPLPPLAIISPFPLIVVAVTVP